MAYHFGNFVWFELIVPDVGRARRFYPETIGWRASVIETAGGPYTMLLENDDARAGIVTPPAGPQPPHWAPYLSVQDVDAAAARVTANGGQVLAPAVDIPMIGRVAPVADPQGATMMLFKRETAEDQTDAMHWTELWAHDAEGMLDFYKAVAEVTVETMPMGFGKYYVLRGSGDQPMGGVMTSPDPKVPPMWLSFVDVDDPDATLTRAQNNGGKIIKPAADMPGIGRFGVFADDQGAVLAVIRPAADQGEA